MSSRRPKGDEKRYEITSRIRRETRRKVRASGRGSEGPNQWDEAGSAGGKKPLLA